MRINVFGLHALSDFPLGLSKGRDGMVLVVDWMPEGVVLTIDALDDVVWRAMDGDTLAQKYIEGSTKHATLQMLIKEFKMVYGPDWAKALRGLADREEAKEANKCSSD